MERRIGYARSANANQGVDAQIQTLKAAGCSEIFSDVGASGLMLARPGLTDALMDVKAGDQLVVTQMDRISRSARDLFIFVDTLMSQYVELETLNDPEEARAIQTLVNYPSPFIARPRSIRTALHRANLWLATIIRRTMKRFRA